MEFCPVQSSPYIQLLHSPILAALLHGTPAAGVSHFAAWYKEWNYGTFAEGEGPRIFGWVAIMSGISAHILVTLVGNLMTIILLLLHNDMELIATIESRQWYAILNSVKLPLYFSMESIGSV